MVSRDILSLQNITKRKIEFRTFFKLFKRFHTILFLQALSKCFKLYYVQAHLLFIALCPKVLKQY